MPESEDDETIDIEQAAIDPRQVAVDGVQVSAHPLKDLIEADKYLAAKKSAKSRKHGFRIAKIHPGGTR